VQQRAKLQHGQGRLGPLQGAGQRGGVGLNALDVAARVAVARLDHVRQHAHGLQVGGVGVEALNGLSPLQAGAHSQAEVVGVKGFEEEVIRAELAGVGGGGRFGAGREEQEGHGRAGRVGAHMLEQRKAVHERHHHVRDDQVGRFALEGFEGFAAVRRAGNAIALGLEDFAHDINNVAVVFGYQYVRRHSTPPRRESGSAGINPAASVREPLLRR